MDAAAIANASCRERRLESFMVLPSAAENYPNRGPSERSKVTGRMWLGIFSPSRSVPRGRLRPSATGDGGPGRLCGSELGGRAGGVDGRSDQPYIRCGKAFS